jgi:hypothetical protein
LLSIDGASKAVSASFLSEWRKTVKFVKWTIGTIIVISLGSLFVNYYSFIFARRVVGVVTDVQQIEIGSAIVSRPATDLPFLHSFAVAIKEATGEIVTSSANDRQWAVVKVGQCVEAKFFPYAPWDLEKAGTYYGARLLKLSDCSAK